MESKPNPGKISFWRAAVLWSIAVLLMLSAVTYQRRTGPTYPKRGEIAVAGEQHAYRLIRSCETIQDARVALPNPGDSVQGRLFFKRFKTDDPFTAVTMAPETGTEGRDEGERQLVGYLPAQPAAGKLEYYLELDSAGSAIRIPADESDENIIIRFKDPVPLPLLASHVLFMFFSVLIGMRTGLGALFAPATVRRWAWVTLGGLTLGGMILGPFVQKYAFGEYWTGFPWGYDLTDNKMLIMWIAWLMACTTVGTAPKKNERVGRWMVGVAAIVMTVVYLIPHSMRGSELDYSKVDQGVAPSEAIGTGD